MATMAKKTEEILNGVWHQRKVLDAAQAQFVNFIQCGSFENAEDFLARLEEKISAARSEIRDDGKKRTITDEEEIFPAAV